MYTGDHKSIEFNGEQKNDLMDGHHKDRYYDSVDDFPVYPIKNEIYADVAKGFDLVYDPDYNSPLETEDSLLGRNFLILEADGYFNSHESMNNMQRNNSMENETPMYVRPYLEDPVFLQPDDDEIELLHPQKKDEGKKKEQKPAAKHFKHDL